MTDFRTILVAVSDDASGRVPLEAAFTLGRTFGSHVDALHVKTDPSNAVPLVGEGMSGVMVEEMINAAERQTAERAQAARAMFDATCAAVGAATAEAPPHDGFSVAWREETGREEDVVARCGRVHDLTVVGRPQSDRELPSLTTLNAALMESARPLLVVPPQAPAAIGRVVAVAWNGSAEASRAVAAAMPFLGRAERVVLLSAREQDLDPSLTVEKLSRYLSWHGIATSFHDIDTGITNAGDVLERQVAAHGADMLVMGAYTHSRLRQLILGGVTRHMLHHAGFPVLMAH